MPRLWENILLLSIPFIGFADPTSVNAGEIYFLSIPFIGFKQARESERNKLLEEPFNSLYWVLREKQ